MDAPPPPEITASAVDEHPSVTLVRRIFAAFAGGNPRILVDGIAEDVVWRVAGAAPVSRVYRGRDETFELFRLVRRLTDGTYRSRLLWALGDDEHAVAVYRATGTRLGRSLDVDQLLAVTLRDGRWAEVLALPHDLEAFETFWA